MSNAKLTWDQVDQIRLKHLVGATVGELVREYGISRNAVYEILRYDSWLERPEDQSAQALICSSCGMNSTNSSRRFCKECQALKQVRQEHRVELQSRDRCDVCGTQELPGNHKNHHVDHNHETGDLRGALCLKCNVAIGAAGDNPLLLERLAAYLRQRGFAVNRTILSLNRTE